MDKANFASALWIDTCIKGATVAFLKSTSNGFVVEGVASLLQSFGSAGALHGLVDGLLHAAGIKISGVEALILSRGPGSFTGIKIGSAFGYGLAQGLGRTAVYDIAPLLAMGLRHQSVGEAKAATAWFLPATRTEGYALIAMPGQAPRMVAVDCQSTLALRGQDGFPVPEDSVVWPGLVSHMLLPWPQLETSVLALGSTLAGGRSLAYWQNELVESVAWALDERPDLLRLSDRPDPLYMRQSAPQERLRKDKGK